MGLIRRVPVAISTLALGVASLGNLLASYSATVRLACAVLSGALVVLLLLRFAIDLKGVRTELENPAALAVLPALFMTLMLLATYLLPYLGAAARWLWVAALALQIVTVVVFLVRYARSSELARALPSWFLIFVGYVVASVTSPAFSIQPLGQALLWLGLIGYAVVLPVIAYRVFRLRDLPEPLLPTVAIFAAPPSLCLMGYLSVADVKQSTVVYALLALCLISLVYAITQLPRVLGLDFHPSFSALTFPFVISAIALKQSVAFLAPTGPTSSIVGAMVAVATGLSLILVIYVLARYAMFLAVPAEQ